RGGLGRFMTIVLMIIAPITITSIASIASIAIAPITIAPVTIEGHPPQHHGLCMRRSLVSGLGIRMSLICRSLLENTQPEQQQATVPDDRDTRVVRLCT